MEKLIEFITVNINTYLLFIIVLGGIFVTKYTKVIIFVEDVYKVLIVSVIFSVLFYLINDCESECLAQYLFTYLFATSFYELIVKYIINKISRFFGEEKNIAKSRFDSPIGSHPDPNKEEK